LDDPGRGPEQTAAGAATAAAARRHSPYLLADGSGHGGGVRRAGRRVAGAVAVRAGRRFRAAMRMYLAHVVLSLRYSGIGRLFRRDRTTAAYACALVEERRDDPAIDRVLDTLEGLCGDLARGILSRPQVRP
jgi:hypothetical protein